MGHPTPHIERTSTSSSVIHHRPCKVVQSATPLITHSRLTAGRTSLHIHTVGDSPNTRLRTPQAAVDRRMVGNHHILVPRLRPVKRRRRHRHRPGYVSSRVGTSIPKETVVAASWMRHRAAVVMWEMARRGRRCGDHNADLECHHHHHQQQLARRVMSLIPTCRQMSRQCMTPRCMVGKVALGLAAEVVAMWLGSLRQDVRVAPVAVTVERR